MARASRKSLSSWNDHAQRRLGKFLKAAYGFPGLRKLGGKAQWSAQLKMVSGPAMVQLNSKYRGKAYSTDVLSFPAPAIFRESGLLGELVICLPVLKRQAKEQGHTSDRELDVLIVHGLLHLLGFDHESDEKEAKTMARWEKKLLAHIPGLIERVR